MTYRGSFPAVLAVENTSLAASFLVEHNGREPGGNGANIAYTLALLGLEPVLVGAVGHDFQSREKELKELGISTDGLMYAESVPTAHCVIATDLDNNQITLFSPAAMALAQDASLGAFIAGPETLVVIAPDDVTAMVRHVEEAASLRARVVFAPGQQITALDNDALVHCMHRSHIVVANDHEWQRIEDRTGIASDAPSPSTLHVRTRGALGASIIENDTVHEIAACTDVAVIDPTGAGDAFLAGLVTGFSHRLDAVEAAQLGTVAAAYALEHHGSQRHAFTPDGFAGRFRETFGSECTIFTTMGER